MERVIAVNSNCYHGMGFLNVWREYTRLVFTMWN